MTSFGWIGRAPCWPPPPSAYKSSDYDINACLHKTNRNPINYTAPKINFVKRNHLILLHCFWAEKTLSHFQNFTRIKAECNVQFKMLYFRIVKVGNIVRTKRNLSIEFAALFNKLFIFLLKKRLQNHWAWILFNIISFCN